MGVGVIFSQLLGGDSGAIADPFGALSTGLGVEERLTSIDPAGQWAALDTVGEIDQTPLPAGGPRLPRYRCPMVTDTGAADEPYGALMLVAFAVPPERKAEVDDWYLNEHIELLMRADGWLRARRYEVGGMTGQGTAWTHLAFHELRDLSVMQSEARRIARSTPWRARLEPEPWFQSAGRWVFKPSR